MTTILPVFDISWHDKPSYLYGANPEEGDVEASVEGEANQVEGEEVKVEANHAEVGMFNFVGNGNFYFLLFEDSMEMEQF